VVSNLIRTHQTAALVCGHSNHIIDARLNERYLGPMDGTINEERQKALGVLPGEESPETQGLRVIEALNHHLAVDETILFVCHGGTVRRILDAAGVREKFNVPNATIYAVLPEDEGWSFHPPS
jgi:broad specificity phosphatase PhoE